MKQIKYTDKQLLVLEILKEIDKLFNPGKHAYDFQLKEYYNKINAIKKIYGIKDKFSTLREYIRNCECGAYHDFVFEIKNKEITVSNISDFEMFYNSKLLDQYYVVDDKSTSNNGNCENYKCTHYLDIVTKDD